MSVSWEKVFCFFILYFFLSSAAIAKKVKVKKLRSELKEKVVQIINENLAEPAELNLFEEWHGHYCIYPGISIYNIPCVEAVVIGHQSWISSRSKMVFFDYGLAYEVGGIVQDEKIISLENMIFDDQCQLQKLTLKPYNTVSNPRDTYGFDMGLIVIGRSDTIELTVREDGIYKDFGEDEALLEHYSSDSQKNWVNLFLALKKRSHLFCE